jgi:HK97 gp10 family phage protein
MPPSPALNPSRYHESVPRVGVSIRMTRNDLPRLTAQRRTDIAAAFTKASAMMVSTARSRCPVRTGYLKSTIREASSSTPPTYIAGLVIGAHYWQYVNYGAGGRPAKPFATQAIEAGRRTLESELARINGMAMAA